MLKLLDSQECKLHSKYSRVVKKKRNVPLILLANELPRSIMDKRTFGERFLRERAFTNMEDMREEIIIATLYGCMERRIKQSQYALRKLEPHAVNENRKDPETQEIQYQQGFPEKTPDVKIDYNKCNLTLFHCEPRGATLQNS